MEPEMRRRTSYPYMPCIIASYTQVVQAASASEYLLHLADNGSAFHCRDDQTQVMLFRRLDLQACLHGTIDGHSHAIPAQAMRFRRITSVAGKSQVAKLLEHGSHQAPMPDHSWSSMMLTMKFSFRFCGSRPTSTVSSAPKMARLSSSPANNTTGRIKPLHRAANPYGLSMFPP
ncbi:hypothetical protein VDGL01_08974 [Verticillium dahliae]